MLEIPFTSDYDQRFITQLSDGNKYQFDARWNERGQTWTFDLTRDSDQALLICGAPMLIGQDLLAPYALGLGGLILADLDKKNTDAGPEDMGKRVICVHLSVDELAAIKAALGPAGASIIASGAVPPLVRSGSPSSGPVQGTTTIIQQTTVNNTVNNITNEGGGTGFGGNFEALDDATGDEVVIYRTLFLAGLNPNPTLTVAAGFLARGGGSIRIYAGGVVEDVGDTGTPSGTSIGTPAAVTVDGTYQIDGTVANPGGIMPIKVTMQSSAPATNIGVDIIQGFVA